jgi:hypothetical protein
MLESDPTDANRAFLYASGEMDATETAAFERRLGEEQPLREALCRAVELTRTLEGLLPVAPPLAYRQRVRQRLLSAGGWWRWLGQPRTYRGHPALWSGLGAAAALLAVLAFPPDWFSRDRPAPAGSVAQEPSLLRDSETALEGADELSTIEMAETWASLPSSEHLARALEEENRRRDRRLTRDEHLLHLPVPPTVRH